MQDDLQTYQIFYGYIYQESKLREGLITPIQFVTFMSHHFSKVDITEDEVESKIDRLTEVHEIENEWDGEEEYEEPLADDVFDR
jgi:hypothetical protein